MESAATPHKSELRKTPLNGLHRRLGAKMVNFGGWDMPVEYPSSGGLIAEHRAVRGSVGVFDVSHMGDIRIRSSGKPGGALAAVRSEERRVGKVWTWRGASECWKERVE